MQLLLVRHGEPGSATTEPGADTGLGADPALTDRGRRQAERLAAALRAQDDTIVVTRSHPDLTRGSWLSAASVGRPVEDWPQEVTLPSSASAAELGAAVLAVLEQPPLR